MIRAYITNRFTILPFGGSFPSIVVNNAYFVLSL